MQVTPQITFRDLPHSEAVEIHLHEKIDKLQHFCHNIVACHVVLEFANKNQHRGNMYDTHITVTVPGKELVSKINEDENMYTSIRTAFDDMTRQLESYVQQMHGEIKNHQPIVSGTIVRLFNGDGFGFIEKADGAEFYFNATHLLTPEFHQLTVGMPVHFVEGMGSDGPQAHRVRVIEQE